MNTRCDRTRARPGGSPAGFTLLEVVFSSLIVALAALVLHSSFGLSRSMIAENRRRLEAEALAMDRILEVFNTHSFTSVVTAVYLPPVPPPSSGLLADRAEIRTMIAPNIGPTPYKWDIEVRVARARAWPGGEASTWTDGAVFRVTRYDIGRN